MDIQLIIVIFIGVVVAAILLRGVYRFFFEEKKEGYCGGCTGCSLSREPNKKADEHNPYTWYLNI